MDRDEEQKHITLAWFDASFLRPSFEEYGLRFNKGGLTAGLGAYYLAEIIEGYFWLALGISLNVFPLDASRSLVRQRASIFRNLPSFAKSWRHVIDSALLENISRAVALNEFFVTKDPRASVHPERLVSHFLAASLMATRFGQDSIARSFVVALNFYSEDLLDVIEAPSFKTTEKTDFAKLERAFGVEVGSILEGYLRCLGHMASFSSFFEGVKEWRGVEPTDRLYFTRNIKQNTGWRIDFGRYTSNRVFLALAERVAESVPRSARRYFDRGFLKGRGEPPVGRLDCRRWHRR